MMETPRPKLVFKGTCPDCAERQFPFPQPLPDPGDDFDWLVRDYDGFRRFVLEELASRFSERKRWTAADLEVVLVEALAAVLDQLSDMADRVASEAYLGTARRPESVRRLLSLVGYDAARAAGLEDDPPEKEDGKTKEQKLERLWVLEPHRMEEARRAGPALIHTQHRMVTVKDYAIRLQEHPLVLRAHAWSKWSGSWSTIRAAVIGWGNTPLDEAPEVEGTPGQKGYCGSLREALSTFYSERNIFLPNLGDEETPPPTTRSILRHYIDAYRMVGQEVILQDAVPVGISLSISVRVEENYFQSEVRRAVEQALGTGEGGFFEPGRLCFGENLYASDIIQTLMALDGVENVCLNRFKKIGRRYPDQAASGLIVLNGLEIAVCDNDLGKPQRGYFSLVLHGGLKG